MEEKKTIFDYLSELFTIYGVMVALFIVFTLIVGSKASTVSTLFQLGKDGLAIATLLQLLGLALFIMVVRNVFLTDLCIKNMSLLIRNVLFFASALAAIVFCVICFGWFPTNSLISWICFFISFAVCTIVSTFLTRAAEKTENAKMAKALERFKE